LEFVKFRVCRNFDKSVSPMDWWMKLKEVVAEEIKKGFLRDCKIHSW